MERRIVFVNVAGSLGLLGQGADNDGTDDGSSTPGGEQGTVDRTDVLRAEDVREEGGDGRETAAVHGEDGEQGDLEEEPLARGAETGHKQEEDKLEREEDEIGIAAAK